MKFNSIITPTIFVVLVITASLCGCTDGEDEEIVSLRGTVAALSTRQSVLEDVNSAQDEFISYLATRPAEDEETVLLKGTAAALSTRQSVLEYANSAQDEFISYLATRPPIVITPVGPDTPPTPYRPVDGRVLIEDGRCCIGGPAGEPLEITITLDAFSPQSEVTDMRIAVGSRFLTEEEMESVPWEPFTREKKVTIPVPANWSANYATVQFRDAEGALSFVFHDDISVEGEPR